jgi:ABC-2 type transport system permease protein
MLNAGFGLLFIPAIGIAMAIFNRGVCGVLAAMGGSAWLDHVLVILCAIAAATTSTVDPAAPSVSLEARTLWLVKSLPVSPWQTLRAKLREQLILSSAANLILLVCMQIAFPLSPAFRVLLTLFVVSFTALSGVGATALAVRLPNLTWTSETYVLKQSAPVFIVIMGGFAYAAVLAALYFLLKPATGLYVGAWTAVNAVAAAAAYFWLRTRGVARLTAL